jgi:hypothetical protein
MSRRPLLTSERAAQERWLAPARAALGPAVAESAWQDGLSAAEDPRQLALRELLSHAPEAG